MFLARGVKEEARREQDNNSVGGRCHPDGFDGGRTDGASPHCWIPPAGLRFPVEARQCFSSYRVLSVFPVVSANSLILLWRVVTFFTIVHGFR